MKKMTHSHIDPKDYSSYEDYLIALEVHEQFLELSQKVTQAVNESETEEEYDLRMEALGFTRHEDPPCGNAFCDQNEFCLWVALEGFQIDCQNRFFEGLLAEKDWIFSEKEMEDYFIKGCHLPSSWVIESNLEHQSISFVLDLEVSLYNSRPESIDFEAFLKQEELKFIFRTLYLFLFLSLRYPKSDKKEKIVKKLKSLLKKNSLLEKSVAKEFLVRFKGLEAQFKLS